MKRKDLVLSLWNKNNSRWWTELMSAVIVVWQKHLQPLKNVFIVIKITSIYDSIQSLVSRTSFLYNLSWGQTGSVTIIVKSITFQAIRKRKSNLFSWGCATHASHQFILFGYITITSLSNSLYDSRRARCRAPRFHIHLLFIQMASPFLPCSTVFLKHCFHLVRHSLQISFILYAFSLTKAYAPPHKKNTQTSSHLLLMIWWSQYKPVHIAQVELKVDIKNGCKQSERQRKKSSGGGEEESGRARTIISNQICAAVIDHLLVHGNTMRAVGQRVQPSLSRRP